MAGGYAEVASGVKICGGTLGVGAVLGGGSLVIDGSANMASGFGKILGQFTGEKYEWNFVENAAEVVSPEYGKNIYNGSQLLLGVYGVSTGLGKLTAETVYRNENILGYIAVDRGKKTWTYVDK